MKKNFLLACLISAVFAAPAGAWELWDQFKATNLTPEGRVVDYSEAKLITTSEGQSYGMFFALVANDKKAFDEMFAWTEKNLGENQPAWLWGIPGRQAQWNRQDLGYQQRHRLGHVDCLLSDRSGPHLE